MAILFKLRAERVMEDGECLIVGYEVDANGKEKARGRAHGETAFCKQAHPHVKGCAQALLDSAFLSEVKDRDGVVVTPAMTVRQAVAAWFDALEARVVPKSIEMPTKTVKLPNDKGVLVDKVVEDKDLT